MRPATRPFPGVLAAVALAILVVPASGRPSREAAIHPLARPVALEDPSGTAMDTLGQALRRADRRQGTARIVVLGASHTAADHFTGFLRRALQRRYGDGGPGLLLPGRPWKGARHDALELQASPGWQTVRPNRTVPDPDVLFGIAGAAVASSGAGEWLRVAPRDEPPPRARFDRVEVWSLGRPDGGTFEVRMGSRVLGTISTRSPDVRALRWEMAGMRRPGPLEIRALGDGEVRILGLVLDRRRPGVTMDALGVPGATFADRMAAPEDLLRETLRFRDPDLLVLAFGTNEAYDPDLDLEAYRTSLQAGLARLRAWAPRASCLVLGPGGLPRAPDPPGSPPGTRRGQITEFQRQAAREAGCAFFDLAALMGEEEGMDRWVAASLASRDRVHLTEAGYRVLGEALLRGLLDAVRRR